MENVIAILNTVLLVAIIQGFIFNIVIHFKNKPLNKAIFYLNLTIFIFTLNNLQSYLVKRDLLFVSDYIKYAVIDVSWNVFISPLFFLFLIHYLKIEKHYRYIIKTTIIVFVGLVLIRVVIISTTPYEIDSTVFKTMIRRYNIWEDVFILVATLMIYFYCIYLFYKLKDRFKYINSFNDLKWLQTFYIFTAVILFLWIVAIFLDFKYTHIKTTNIYTPLRFATSFLIYWLGYQGYNQYLLTRDRISLRTALKKQDTAPLDKIETPKFDKLKYNTFQEIKQKINTKKMYLDPLLSLDSLSKKLNTNTSDLSKLINNFSNSNFTDFINKFRIRNAERILLDNNFSHYTIMSIGFECGFNSKSTFYAAFKKFTGKTPVEFRKYQK